VEVRPREIRVYQTADDHEPFWESLDRLQDEEGRSKIFTGIDRAEAGNLGDWDSVGGGVFELILDFGPGYRIYFGQDGDTIVLLLVGMKKSQPKDIKTARYYWSDYNA
jgi:putative addiction module killer protein